ncbi:MAG: hypothetical protein KKH34_02605 [Candidatus Omnitrophica bacterium]|nr:hypothetical protein [Candidatus Omnitrophota bacterium]MCG2704136.1 hypothetical protein [Candidatus Omnitrophota bacterium]
MKILHNNKGAILIMTYLVLFVVVVIMGAVFTFFIQQNKQITLETEGVKALNKAEMGVAYAVYESQNLGWKWYTHKWNNDKDALLPLDSSDASYLQQLRADCYFNADGFYVANNGNFMVKAYPDKNNEDTTIVVAVGISGDVKKVLQYKLNRKGIYDFFYYSPYDIDLDNAVGVYPRLNGGGIHSNGNIRLDYPVRLENICELSTGENGKIYYAGADQYPAPNYLDSYDGVYDGKAPMVRLDKYTDVFRDDANNKPGDFGYYFWDKYGTRYWGWKSNATYYANTNAGEWLTQGFRNSEYYFYGDKSSWNYIAPNAKDTQISNLIINDNKAALNKLNIWIKPYESIDAAGKITSGPWTEIPAELEQQWNWAKYKGRNGNDKTVTFYTYDNSGNKVNVEETYWAIEGGKVIGVDPADLAAHPGAKTYWDMFKSQDYWTAIGKERVPGYMDDEIMDETYGDELASGGTVAVKHTDSAKQLNAWSNFLQDSKLKGIVRTAGHGGENLDPPQFNVTYSRLAQRQGIYIGLDESFDGTYNDKTEWRNVLEKSIDAAVDTLTDGGSNGKVAKKVKFINTFTGEWNIVLEINLGEMQAAGAYPDNGIIYSQVPLRLANAETLPRKFSSNGFTVLGEENVYLKGNFNTKEWVVSAIISKKRVFTLSNDFNDPQVKPATGHYRDYPYLYVKQDLVTKIFAEADPTKGEGQWVYPLNPK